VFKVKEVKRATKSRGLRSGFRHHRNQHLAGRQSSLFAVYSALSSTPVQGRRVSLAL